MYFIIGYPEKALIKLFKKDFKGINFMQLINNLYKLFWKKVLLKKKFIQKNYFKKIKNKIKNIKKFLYKKISFFTKIYYKTHNLNRNIQFSIKIFANF